MDSECPAVHLAGAVADGLPVEPLLGVLGELLPDRLDPLTAAAAQPQLGSLRLRVFDAAVDNAPPARAGGVEVADLVGRGDLAVQAGPVVDAGVPGDGPPPRVSLRLHRS